MKTITTSITLGQVLFAFLGGAAPDATATWDYSKVTDNITPPAAADWFDSGNWNPSVPNGAGWAADLSGATGCRYVAADGPLTLGGWTATPFAEGSGSATVFLGNGRLTLDNSACDYNLNGGRVFADINVPEGQSDGFANTTELAGRFCGGNYLVTAGGIGYFRLDRFASSANPVRTDDFTAQGLYRASGHIYVNGPRKGTAHAEAWTVTAGSPYIYRSAVLPKVAAGATVTCDGVFPDGTFVRRIFDDNWIELSNPADQSAGSGERTLAFAAIEPKTTMTIPTLMIANSWEMYSSFSQPDEDGDFRVEVGELVAINGNAEYPFWTHVVMDGMYPATVVIHDAAAADTGTHANADRLRIQLGSCHFEFAETGREGARAGFPDSRTTTFVYASPSTVSRLTVTNGVDALIGRFTGFTHTILKDGKGSLELDLTENPEGNTGTLVVKEGTVVLPEGAWVATVAVSNGATLKIMGDFRPQSFIAEKGAVVSGNGTLIVEDVKSLDGLEFAENAGVRIVGGSGEILTDVPAPKVIGEPAFWLDASALESFTFASDDGTTVMRWNDVRKMDTADGYGYAATDILSTQAPVLVKDGDGNGNHVYFENVGISGGDISSAHELGWSRPLTNIRAVFQVVVVGAKGGQFLGSSARLASLTGRSSDWTRPAGAAWNSHVFYEGNVDNKHQLSVLNAPFYLNGQRRQAADGYLHNGSAVNVGGETRYVAQVADIHPSEPVAADCFATDVGASWRDGDKCVCEIIVYTNELTYAERVSVAGYLLKKWCNCEIDSENCTGASVGTADLATSPRFETSVGETLYVKNVTGQGALRKSGSGALYVENLEVRGQDVVVEGGRLHLRSATTPTVDELPEGASFHMDASVASYFNWFSPDDRTVSGWKSVDNAATWYSMAASPAPVWKENQMNGLGMLDFGPAQAVDGNTVSTGMYHDEFKNLRSLFLVENTAQGGTSLFGWRGSWSIGGLVRAGWPDGVYTAENNALVYRAGNAADIIAQPGGARTRLNGLRINPGADGFTGGNDLLSMVTYADVASDCWGFNTGYGSFAGGGMVGECIAYARGLNDRDVRKVEAYLKKKWYGVDIPEFRPAVVGRVKVASGASLEVDGNAPLTLASLTGGGTVSGDVLISADADFTLVAQGDGTMEKAAAVSGTLDLSAGGVVKVTGSILALAPGTYTVVEAGMLTGSLENWSVDLGSASKRRTAVLSMDGACVLLTISKFGFALSIR